MVTSKHVLAQKIFCSCVIGTTFAREKLGSLKEATTATPKTTSIKKMNFYFAYESWNTLGSFTLFITIKALAKLNLGHLNKFETEF